eukprot:4080019-Amphidinium_carterae.1
MGSQQKKALAALREGTFESMTHRLKSVEQKGTGSKRMQASLAPSAWTQAVPAVQSAHVSSHP